MLIWYIGTLLHPGVEPNLRGSRAGPFKIQLVDNLILDRIALEDLEKTLRSRSWIIEAFPWKEYPQPTGTGPARRRKSCGCPSGHRR